ncbi:MAG: peptide ABC transporter permease, partial [SAR116 cluster bacterium]|nr:peptide ABC transporter permease [SAR116 cluster bacterium]
MKHRFKNFQNFWRDFSANKVAVVALFIFSLILFVAIFAPLVSPTDPYDLNTVSIMNSRLPPLSEDFGGNFFLLGTDGAGRDMVSAIFYGLRVSLGVGVLSGIFALIIGSFFGISAAFFRG